MYATLYVRLPANFVWIKNKNKEPRVPAEKSEHYQEVDENGQKKRCNVRIAIKEKEKRKTRGKERRVLAIWVMAEDN